MLLKKFYYYLMVFSESEFDFILSKEMFVIDDNSVPQIISNVTKNTTQRILLYCELLQKTVDISRHLLHSKC